MPPVARTESAIPTPYPVEHDHQAVPHPRATVDQRGLVERARGGDHDAFTVLARDSATRLERAARLILRDPELARDAVQEALIRAWRDLRGLRDPERFDAWLHRLTVNACLDIARRRRRRVIEVARWSEDTGCTGILVYTDNSLVDPWLVAQIIIENTERRRFDEIDCKQHGCCG